MARHALYFNGLNKGTVSIAERWAFRKASAKGVFITHVPINWLSTEPFSDMLDRITKIVQDEQKIHPDLVLIGASAGGSLAVNVLGRLGNTSTRVITLCSRLRETTLPWWDVRTLQRMAHLGMSYASQSFYDSVLYCQNTTLSQLNQQQKQHITTILQWADEVVPRTTMRVPGLSVASLPGFGHQYGILMGIAHVSGLLDAQKDNNETV